MSARTALNAPAHIIFQRNTVNVNSAPSLVFGGGGIQDHRLDYNSANSATGAGVIGWYGTQPMCISAVPSTLSAVNIAAAAVPVAGTAMTLVSVTGAGITVLAAAQQMLPSLNTVPAASLVIDSAVAYQKFGSSFTTVFYDPTKMLARNVRITSAGNDTTATFLVSGYDIYGYPMSELITGASGAVASGKKAFKYITSVLPAGTLSGSNVSVGTGDVFGFPLVATTLGFVRIIWNAAVVTATTGFLTADGTSPATTTTGDVRGTYAVQTASDNAKRLEIQVFPNVNNMSATASGVAIGLFGVTQV